MSISIRRAGPDDLAPLLVLVEEYCAADDHAFDPDLARAGLDPLLLDDRLGVVWVAQHGDELDGYAAVTWGWSIEIGGADVVLDEIYVRAQGDGTGSRLLETLERDCRDRGVKRIFMETELENESARRLYARHGYRADSSIWMAKDLS